MIDFQVERLRRLRASALRVRAVARRLGAKPALVDERLMMLSACAAWRLARMVSGHLRAHPYARFQRDAGLGTLLMNGLRAQVAALGASSRAQAMAEFETHLKALSHELDDARALTRTSELSDLFGRSQIEIRALVGAVERKPGGAASLVSGGGAPRVLQRFLPLSRKANRHVRRADTARGTAMSVGSATGADWPYLGL